MAWEAPCTLRSRCCDQVQKQTEQEEENQAHLLLQSRSRKVSEINDERFEIDQVKNRIMRKVYDEY